MDKLKYMGSLYINSADRQTGTTLSNAIYNFSRGGNNIDYLAVNSISMLNNVYDITGTFKYSFNSTDFSIVFNSNLNGEYTATALASLLQSQIRTQTGSTTLTVVFNTVSNKFVFATGNASTMLVYNFTYLPIQLGMVIDASETATLTPTYPAVASTSFTFLYPANLATTAYYDFVCPDLMRYDRASMSTNKFTTQLLYRLKNNLGYGTTLVEKDINLRHIKYDSTQEITNTNLQIYNDKGVLVDMNNSNYNIEISLFSCR